MHFELFWLLVRDQVQSPVHLVQRALLRKSYDVDCVDGSELIRLASSLISSLSMLLAREGSLEVATGVVATVVCVVTSV